MPQFDFSFWVSQVFWVIFSFLFLFICMQFCIVPNIRNIFKKRTEVIENDEKEAAQFSEKADYEYSVYQAYIHEAEHEAQNLLHRNYQELAAHKKNTLLTAERDMNKEFMKITELEKQRVYQIEEDFKKTSDSLAHLFIEQYAGVKE